MNPEDLAAYRKELQLAIRDLKTKRLRLNRKLQDTDDNLDVLQRRLRATKDLLVKEHA